MKKYNVYDTIEKDFLITDASSQEIAEMIGIPMKRVSTQASNGYVYDERYKITYTIESMVTVAPKCPPELSMAWEDTRKAAELLRSGGHIVTKRINGKLVRWTEEKK